MLGMKIGIDFGSANITLFSENEGIIVCEPSLAVIDRYSEKTIAVGNAAKEMLGKLPGSMRVVRPIKDGIINDFDIAVDMLSGYINRICRGRLFKPNVLMCVPSSVTELQKKTVFDAVTKAGCARACFVDEALASAVGAGVSLSDPAGAFICDIGGGTTDAAVVCKGNIAVSASVKTGGNDLTACISDYILKEHNVEVGPDNAEYIKKTAGAAVYRNEEIGVVACGKSLDTGYPVTFEITSSEIYWVLKAHTDKILGCIKDVFSMASPELIPDVYDSGITLTGGSSQLFGMDRFIEWNTGIRTVRAPYPEKCAALGLGRLLDNLQYLESHGYIFTSGSEDNDNASDI